MKFFRIGAAALCVFAAFSASADDTTGSAANDDSTVVNTVSKGSVVFNGKVIASACQLNTEDKVVDLGTIASGILRNGGESEKRSVTIRMDNCAQQTVAEMTVKDAMAGDNPGMFLRTASGEGFAEGVAVRIKRGENIIDFRDPSSTTIQINDGKAFDWTNDGVTFEAAMVHSDPNATVKAGTVKAQMDYTVEYK